MAQPTEATLYVIPGSHPAMVARRMLELKGIPYKRVDLMPVISRGALRALRFPSNTVPSLKIDGRKLTGSREIGRELDRIRPEPPLYPTDPDQRVAVEDAERWGDEVLQAPVRRILWNALKRDRAPLRSYAEGARLGVPIGLAVRTAAPIVAAAARMNSADDETVRADLAALPGQLQRVDDWIAEGVLGQRSAERGRPPDRRQPSPGDDAGRPAAGDRGASRRGDGAARHPRLSRPRPSGAPAAWLEPLRARSRR